MKKNTKLTIKNCPGCRSSELLAFDGDFFCVDCSWDSLKMSVDRGDLDNIYNSFSVSDNKSEGAQLIATESDFDLVLDFNLNLEATSDGSAA